ncbi:MAG: hypothetical protein ACREO0_08835 [Pseudoxanthomonas sp.]
MLLLVLMLATCSCASNPTAPAADAGAVCYAKCTPSPTDTGVRWEGDPEDPKTWDRLGEEGGVIHTLSKLLFRCEAARAECAGFINDLKRQKVIQAKEQP